MVSYLLFRNKYFIDYSKVFILLVSLGLVTVVVVGLAPKISPGYSKEILAENGEVVYVFLADDDQWRLKVKEEDVSDYYKKLILFKEDKYFYYHFGINPLAVVRAIGQNIYSGKVVSGASTITMQLARLLEPKERTVGNKLIEMFRALQLEARYSKKEILEFYLNLLPYGKNIVGVRSAAWKYFHKTPDKLNLLEAAVLTQLSDNPQLIYYPEKLERRAKKFLKKAGEHSIFPEDVVKYAIKNKLHIGNYSFPKNAPHFAFFLRNKNLQQIETYLDLNLQKQAEKIAKDYVRNLYAYGITNVAVLVVRNSDGAVVSYVGSADFYNEENQGQVNGVEAFRSPGSTLKPFLYAVAMNKGNLTPKKVLYDVPTTIRGYSPQNYDGEFSGAVFAYYALAKSLNVPAVRLLKQTGLSEFLQFLSDKLRMSKVRERYNSLGLSVILGGCEVSLRELVSAYKIFANGGTFSPLKYTKKDSSKKMKVFNQGVCYWITEILSSNDRPDFSTKYLNLTANLPEVAWKTGTSYGYKDAWAIGYTPEYTIGVWAGNFNGKSSPVLNGTAIAVPLMFKVMKQLKHRKRNFTFDKRNIISRKVCSESGLLPTKLCENLMIDEYIKGITKLPQCNLKKTYFVSLDGSVSYCKQCLPTNYVEKVYYNYPKDYLLYLYNKGEKVETVPPHNPACQYYYSKKEGIKIIFPVNSYIYYSRKKMKLKISYDNSVNSVWVIHNDRLKGSFSPTEAIEILPEPGRNVVECIDNLGRNDKIEFFIKTN